MHMTQVTAVSLQGSGCRFFPPALIAEFSMSGAYFPLRAS